MSNVDMSMNCCAYKQTEESHEHLDSCINVLRGKTKLLTRPLNDTSNVGYLIVFGGI